MAASLLKLAPARVVDLEVSQVILTVLICGPCWYVAALLQKDGRNDTAGWWGIAGLAAPAILLGLGVI